jgi:beta-phosphoglucomutase-like phosphatase (HAD superfamily)
MTSTRLIIFDCNRVLINSEIVVCRLVAEELSRLGYPLSTEEVLRRFAGRPEREIVADIEADWGCPIPAEFFARVKERMEAAYASELRAVPGVAEALDDLRVPLCVASSSYPEKLRLGLHSVNLLERFDPHVSSAYVVAHASPGPTCSSTLLVGCARLMEAGTELVFDDFCNLAELVSAKAL